jgi:uncharacterized protein YjeT (DUF2065 family)
MSAETLWVLGILSGLIGILAFLVPSAARSLARILLHTTLVRIAGLVLMVLGALVFARASETVWPLSAKVVGVLVFIKGGVWLLQPIVVVTITEWWIAKSHWFQRFCGIVCVAVAALFIETAGPFQTPVEPAEEGQEAPGAPVQEHPSSPMPEGAPDPGQMIQDMMKQSPGIAPQPEDTGEGEEAPAAPGTSRDPGSQEQSEAPVPTPPTPVPARPQPGTAAEGTEQDAPQVQQSVAPSLAPAGAANEAQRTLEETLKAAQDNAKNEEKQEE